MVIWLFFTTYSLFNSLFFFAPLFLFVYLYLFRQYMWLVGLLIGFGLLGDLLWVFPLGFSGLMFSLLILALSLYSHRYNVLNLVFLLLILFGASVGMYYIVRPGFSWIQLVSFLLFFVVLQVQIRELHKERLKNLS